MINMIAAATVAARLTEDEEKRVKMAQGEEQRVGG